MAAKIIKGGAAGKEAAKHVADIPEGSGAVVHKRVIDAREQAAKIVSDAEARAAMICEDAKRMLEDAKKGRDDAIKKGHAEGESKGLAKVTEKLIRLDRLKEQFYNSAEPEVIKLVMEIAEKVIGKLAGENPDVIKSVVRLALERALGDRITVRLNPADHKNITSSEGAFRDVIDRTKRLVFREDEAISKGGCIVETEVGTIDAQMETQLQAIRKALMV